MAICSVGYRHTLLPQAHLQRRFLIVTIDYFRKWIEAESLAKINEWNASNFVWKNIVCRFGIPKVIISDNARQFNNDGFKLFCSDLTISPHLVILRLMVKGKSPLEQS